MPTDERPDVLYHYTTPHGLLGIIESREVWATKMQYMNDASEFSGAVRVAGQEFDRLSREQGGEPEINAICTLLHESLDRISEIHVCVFCLSERGNELSQWRAYCRTGGFAIGFKTAALAHLAAPQGFRLVQCLYESGQQRAALRPVVADSVQAFKASLRANPGPLKEVLERVVPAFFIAFAHVAPLIKNAAFAEEREWRLVSHPLPTRHPQLRYRATDRMLIPYFALRLQDAEGQFVLLGDIVMGPTSNWQLAFSALEMLAVGTGINWSGLSPSHIPYRVL